EPFVVVSGGDGGPLTNGVAHAGTIALGDLDMWSFSGQAGDNVVLRMGAAAFSPEIQLYGPNGALLQDIKSANGNVHDVVLTNQLPTNGVYTVVVDST